MLLLSFYYLFISKYRVFFFFIFSVRQPGFGRKILSYSKYFVQKMRWPDTEVLICHGFLDCHLHQTQSASWTLLYLNIFIFCHYPIKWQLVHYCLIHHHLLQAIMKSYKVTGADPANPEKFLAYMVPSPNEVDMLVLISKSEEDQH